MVQIRGFIISLIAAAAASAIIEGFVPESDKGGLKKYLKYLISLTILVTLLSPLKSLVAAIPSIADGIITDGYSYASVDSAARVNSLIALHIRDAVCDKFGIDGDDISAELSEDGIRIALKKRFGIFGRDIHDYIKASFGIESEVIFYE